MDVGSGRMDLMILFSLQGDQNGILKVLGAYNAWCFGGAVVLYSMWYANDIQYLHNKLPIKRFNLAFLFFLHLRITNCLLVNCSSAYGVGHPEVHAES